MKNFSHNKGCNLGINPAHVEPPLITIIRETRNSKSDKVFIHITFFGDHTSSISDLYWFKMSLLCHRDTEEFLLFIHNFKMIIAAIGMLRMDSKIHYLLRYSVEKRCVGFTCFPRTWKIQKPKMWIIILMI